jgi:hypothetical protein
MGILTAASDLDYYADLFCDELREDDERDDYDEDDAADEREHFARDEADR